MNVYFLGAPGSGKTTTAALVFAQLKTLGLPVEFVLEYARTYIAKKRYKNKLSPEHSGSYRLRSGKAARLEDRMTSVCGDEVIVLSDSWSLSALLYMTEATRTSIRVAQMIKYIHENPIDLLYVTAPIVQDLDILDPNRVHSREQSTEIDKQIPDILNRFGPPGRKAILLRGSPEERAATVLRDIKSFIELQSL